MASQHWLQLSLTSGLGPILIGRLIELTGSAAAAIGVSVDQLQQVEGIGQAKARAIGASLRQAGQDAEAQMYKAGQMGASILCPDDPGYPQLLIPLPDRPPVLFISGSLEARDLQSLAIVGSRGCTYYGREQADRFGGLLAGAGFTVISGGARGIDSAAHRGALRHPMGRTIAVLGSGLDVPYPPENQGLFKEIAQRGAVISEFPLGTSPTPENFPRRNRVVSGMSRGVLVVEAGERSGALITARLANEEHGRPVFALPGRVDSPMSVGPHRLIRDGAILAGSLEDIIGSLDPLPPSAIEPMLFPDSETEVSVSEAVASSVPISLSDAQRAIITHLGSQPAGVEHLIQVTSLPAATILRELTFLTLKGMVKRVDGQTFVSATNARRG